MTGEACNLDINQGWKGREQLEAGLGSVQIDLYVAVFKPLHYTTIMNNRVCTALVVCCWFACLLIILPLLGLGLQLQFCDSNVTEHFGCDAPCSDSVIEKIEAVLC